MTGDTPNIRQPVRMVWADTPEQAHYAGRPELAQVKLDACRQRLLNGWMWVWRTDKQEAAELLGVSASLLDGLLPALRNPRAGDLTRRVSH